ncbi:MAG: acyl carrier protein [Bacteroidales bacterium]|nr:acyl carrier protein [Bacteroidales bacterium]MCF8456084.1 acyl carrier protein [Bacteroidales bacterium]
MDKENILKDIETIFRSVLNKDSISLAFDSSANDVEGWDSITHIMLVVEIEKKFKVRFKAREIQGWQTIGDIVNSLAK